MKEAFRKISVVLLLAAAELLLGILLLINPVGLTTAVLVGLGILLIAVGIFNLYKYIRLPREEANQTWNLAEGAGIVTIGIVVLLHQPWLSQKLGANTFLYGGMMLALAFLQLQITVDALRGSRHRWPLMALSFAVSVVLAVLLLTNALGEGIVWIVTGIVLIMKAFLDTVYFVMSRKSAPSETPQAAIPAQEMPPREPEV